MESYEAILDNVRTVVGCNGVRTLEEIAPMRQCTIERRLTAAQDRLSPDSLAAIYTVWLHEQILRIQSMPPRHIVQRWVYFLAHRGYGPESLRRLWMHAAFIELRRWTSAMLPAQSRDISETVVAVIRDDYPPGLCGPAITGHLMPLPRTPSPLALSSREDWASARVPTSRQVSDVVETPLTPCDSAGADECHASARADIECELCRASDHHASHCPLWRLTGQVPAEESVECRICRTSGQHSTEKCPENLDRYSPRLSLAPRILGDGDLSHLSLEPHPPSRGPYGDGYHPPPRATMTLPRRWEDVPMSGVLDSALESSADGSAGSGLWRAAENCRAGFFQHDGDRKTHRINDDEKEALRQADEFLAQLSEEIAQREMRDGPSLPPQVPPTELAIEKAPKRQKSLAGARIDMLESRHASPVTPRSFFEATEPIKATEPTKATSEPVAPTEAAPVEIKLGKTTKAVADDSQYSVVVETLFRNRANVWVNNVKRPTALDMWDRLHGDKVVGEPQNAAVDKTAEEMQHRTLVVTRRWGEKGQSDARPRQNDLLARLLDLASQEDLVQDGVDFVKVEYEIELADIAEEGVEHLDEEVDGLEKGELVVVGVDAGAEEEAGVATVDNLVVAELDEIGLVLLVAGSDEPVDLALELDLLLVAVGGVPLGEPGLSSVQAVRIGHAFT
ncbi:hypothetical protein DCS_00437 [Drechmeria coniospora]|uniref:Uncharacterized protein n=1 Tax=Drechmeria coniospora TaxID=98403 RepID=A0A151GQB9_DRECN|nr:hypothetical protein DCS_00437 [Drechmeria coniospora]KYK59307.1 hypothetical protein DCS_00437 [Drechmeria coniospora]